MPTETTLKFNINLNRPSPVPTTPSPTPSPVLPPNTGFANNSTINIAIFSATLVIAIIGAILVVRFFRKRKRRRTLPFFVSLALCALLAITSSFSLVKALEKTLTLDADILSTDKIAYVKDTITIPDAITKGFTLSIYHDSANPDGKLVNKQDSSQYLLPTTGSKGSPVALSDGSYGITLTEPTDNSPIWFAPTADASIPIYKTTDATPTNHKLDIYYGVKAKDLKAGVYTGSIKYKVALNATFSGITTMQEMTPEICRAETTPYAYRNGAEHNSDYSNIVNEMTDIHTDDRNKVPETILKDTRDNKTYVVRKLADGNCWMAQNLAFSPQADQVLTDADTDMNGGRTFTTPGPSATGDSWNISGGTSKPHYLEPKAGYEYRLEQLDPAGHLTDRATVSSVGSPTQSTGNYYDWVMATAGGRNDEGNSAFNAEDGKGKNADSICPKGWMLPNPALLGPSYYNLLKFQYNWALDGEGITDDPKLVARAVQAPFNYVRADAYDGFYGRWWEGIKFSNHPHQGRLWTNTFVDYASLYTLAVESSFLQPAHKHTWRRNLLPMRCVAR